MIQMRVRQDDGIDLARRNRQLFPVALTPFLLALEQTAIDEDLNSLFAVAIKRSVDEMLRSGHRPGCAQKLDVRQILPPGLSLREPRKPTTEAPRYGENE